MAKIQWKQAYDSDGNKLPLYVSNTGLVKDSSGNLLKLIVASNGYIVITYKRTNYFVHRLVASAFIQKDLKGMDIHHLDKDRANNNVENLKVLSHSMHAVYSNINGVNADVIKAVADEIIRNELSPKDIAAKYNVSRELVYKLLHHVVYEEIIGKYDFSNYKFLRDTSEDKKAMIEELRDMVRKGVPSKEITQWLVNEKGQTREKAYYYAAEARKYVKKEKAGKLANGKRLDYKEYFPVIDDMIMTGKNYELIFDYLSKTTDFDDIQIRNLIQRRIKHHQKYIEKQMMGK